MLQVPIRLILAPLKLVYMQRHAQGHYAHSTMQTPPTASPADRVPGSFHGVVTWWVSNYLPWIFGRMGSRARSQIEIPRSPC